MTEKETLLKLLHDLSTSISVLLLLEDQMPADANAAVLKIRQIIEKYRKESNDCQFEFYSKVVTYLFCVEYLYKIDLNHFLSVFFCASSIQFVEGG